MNLIDSFIMLQIVSDYLQPLAQNEYVIKDTLLFVEIIKNDILDPDEEYFLWCKKLVYQHTSCETINYTIK